MVKKINQVLMLMVILISLSALGCIDETSEKAELLIAEKGMRAIANSNPELVAATVGENSAVVIVHQSNPVTDLTMEQLKDIYTGKITNWKDVGGTDSAIMVLTCEKGSEERNCFEQAIESEISEHAVTCESAVWIQKTVFENDQAIGFVPLRYTGFGIKSLRIDGVEPTIDSIIDGEYPISCTSWIVKSVKEICGDVAADIEKPNAVNTPFIT
ncbi:MAG: substrate-binding domain-containing protein [Candidatus Pacebacteria bacterium]|nr:substrate-binding domain-containing protein [Candidatus Paceibacterota bacterium]